MPRTLTGLILIVDDQPTNLEVICATLTDVGLDVAFATSGERALQQIARERPDLILLDIMMPGLDGFETCQRLKANPTTCDIPVIFMTALADTQSKVTALELGAVDYVTKPFQEQEVLARVKTHLQLSRLTQNLEQAVQQATAELQASRAAEEAQKAAIAREREQAARARTTELVRANDIMRECLDRVSQATDLEQLRPNLLESLIKLVGAIGCSLWRYNASDGSVSLDQEFADGKFHTRATSGFAHPEKHFFTPDHAPSFEKHQRLIAGETLTLDVRSSDVFLLNEREHMLAQGISTIIVLPMTAAGQHLGRLALNFREVRVLSPAEGELAKSIANQVALVLKMVSLAEQIEQAAIAREQEQAAQQRAVQLTKANASLRKSLTTLASELDLNQFLGQVLTVIADLFDSPMTEYWYHQGDTAWLGLMIWQDQIYDRTATAERLPHHPGLTGFQLPPEQTPSLQQRQEYFILENWLTTIPNNPNLPRIEWEKIFAGFEKKINFPLIMGDHCIGALIIRLPQGYAITTDQIELTQALTHQVTLAAQLTRLADESKQTAILEERNRMARDIHDTLAQSFTGIIMQMEALKTAPDLDSETMRTALNQIGDLARLGLSEARRSVQALRPAILETANFPQALRNLLRQVTAGTAIQTALHIEGTPDRLTAAIEENLLRIAQEALTNAMRHGQAQKITLFLLFEPEHIYLQISDNGHGFVPHSSLVAGFGIIGMQERTHNLGGRFYLVSQPGQGTEITVTVPIAG